MRHFWPALVEAPAATLALAAALLATPPPLDILPWWRERPRAMLRSSIERPVFKTQNSQN